MINIFIALTDKDKRIMLILFLLIIVAIAFIAVIGALITRVMKWQGSKLDDLTHDVVVTNVIEDRKQFLHYARIKNWRLFVVQSWVPLLILIVASLTLILRNTFANDWSYNLIDYEKTGFNTLFFIWDFDDPDIYTDFFGTFTIIHRWPPIINYPHFSIEAWASYIFFFGMLVGGGWYLFVLQALIARTYQMYKRSYTLYNKSLEGYNKYREAEKNANQQGDTK